MNNQNNDFLANLFKAALSASLVETQKIDTQVLIKEIESPHLRRRYLEYHPRIKTGVTDVDMLLFRIDMALDSGDVGLFMRLTEELNGLEV